MSVSLARQVQGGSTRRAVRCCVCWRLPNNGQSQNGRAPSFLDCRWNWRLVGVSPAARPWTRSRTRGAGCVPLLERAADCLPATPFAAQAGLAIGAATRSVLWRPLASFGATPRDASSSAGAFKTVEKTRRPSPPLSRVPIVFGVEAGAATPPQCVVALLKLRAFFSGHAKDITSPPPRPPPHRVRKCRRLSSCPASSPRPAANWVQVARAKEERTHEMRPFMKTARAT